MIQDENRDRGWLAPDGKFYPTTYEERHIDIAENCASDFYAEEWAQQEPSYASAYTFLWARGWIMLDTQKAHCGGWFDPTQAQLEYMGSIPYLSEFDHGADATEVAAQVYAIQKRMAEAKATKNDTAPAEK